MGSDAWIATRLGSEIEILTGFPFQSAEYTEAHDGVRLLRGDNVAQGMLRWDGMKKWPSGNLGDVSSYLLQKDDVVLAMDRPWIEAGLKYASVRHEDLPCLLVQRVARLRGGPQLSTRFLRYLVGSREFTIHILGVQTGTAVPHISGSQIKAFEFLRPPLSIQRAIANVLGTLDDKIDLNRRMNDTLEAMARAVFRSWFVDFDPVRAKAEGRKPDGLDAATAKLFPETFEDSALGSVPKGWRVVQLGEHVEVAKGLSYKGEGLAEVGVALHNLNSVYEGGGYKHEGIKHYVGEYRPGHIIRAGDVIVTNTEQGHDHLLIGYSALIPKRYGDLGLFTHHTYRVRPLPGSPLTSPFIHYLLLTSRFRGEVIGYTNGTTVNMLPADGLKRPRLVLPPAELVRRFTDFVIPLIDKAEANHDESRSLTVTRDALLPKLLSGEVTSGALT